MRTDPEEAIEGVLALLDLQGKVRLVTGANFWTTQADQTIGLRSMVLSDGPVGVRGQRWDERDPSVAPPSPTALAATWDEPLVERLGGLLAAEARRKGVGILLTPTVNLHRTPLGGRHFECLSEDPLLSGRIGAAYVRGLQAYGIAATAKHYVAKDSETNRFTVDVRVDERALHELYLAPFEQLVVEGRRVAGHGRLQQRQRRHHDREPLAEGPAQDRLGFDGVVVSDWWAARSTEPAAQGGLDLVMPGPDGPWGTALAAAVNDGRVPEAALDDKVRRILRLAARVGALEGVPPDAPVPGQPTPEQVAALLRDATAAAMVLEAQAAGLEGLVVWGLHRDTADIRAIGLPVFSLGAVPTGPQRLDDRPQDALDSATIGDWTVTREDVVLGDDDSVLFVPAVRAGEILTLGERIRDTERRQAERMRGGDSLRSQVRFDTYLAQRQQRPSLSFREHLRSVGGAIEE